VIAMIRLAFLLGILASPALAAPAGPATIDGVTPVEVIRRGEIIAEAQLNPLPIPVNRAQTVLRMADVVGRQARRDLAPGQPIRTYDVQAPEAVKRGEIVTMVLAHGGMIVAAQGRAMETGSIGDTIRVQNTVSQRIVYGAIAEDGTILIAPVAAPKLPARLTALN